MRLSFADLRLARAYADPTVAVRLWGDIVARRYVQRVEVITSATDTADLGALAALRLHPLKGRRTGQWAMVLHGRWRLILTIEGQRATILEVSNHYDD